MFFRYFCKFIDKTLDPDSEAALIVHVNAVLNWSQCWQLCCTVCSKGCLLMSGPTWEREERETRYVLRAMLHDQSRGLGWEVRDVWGVRGQGCPVWVTPGLEWDTVIEFRMTWRRGDVKLGWTQLHIPCAMTRGEANMLGELQETLHRTL